jgi:hypothetical protein
METIRMKSRNITLILLLCMPNAYSASSFTDFYHQSSNWSSGVVGNGELVIDEEVVVTEDVRLCNVQITVVEGGQLKNDSYLFSLSDCGAFTESTQYLSSESETTVLTGQDGVFLRYLDFGGEDRYVVSTNLAGSLLLVDNQASTLLLPVGLTIDTTEFTADGVRLTIHGQELTVLGRAQDFTYVFAGEESDPTAGVARSYRETANTFGADIPNPGEAPVTGTVSGTVQPDGSLLEAD